MATGKTTFWILAHSRYWINKDSVLWGDGCGWWQLESIRICICCADLPACPFSHLFQSLITDLPFQSTLLPEISNLAQKIPVTGSVPSEEEAWLDLVAAFQKAWRGPPHYHIPELGKSGTLWNSEWLQNLVCTFCPGEPVWRVGMLLPHVLFIRCHWLRHC